MMDEWTDHFYLQFTLIQKTHQKISSHNSFQELRPQESLEKFIGYFFGLCCL